MIDELQVDRAAERARSAASPSSPTSRCARQRNDRGAESTCVACLHGCTITMSFGGGMRHVQLLARDTLDEGVSGPGTLLELQLAPFDVQVVALRAQLLELNEQLARAVLAVDRARGRQQAPRPKAPRLRFPVSSPQVSCHLLGDAQQRAARARIARPPPPCSGGACGRPAAGAAGAAAAGSGARRRAPDRAAIRAA